LKVGIPSNGITAGDVNFDVLDADGSRGNGFVARHFAMHAIVGRSPSKSDFRTVKLILPLVLLSVEHEKLL
jgi:hypothetical protein